jgi:GNAT superfamily N-acetyltransferase
MEILEISEHQINELDTLKSEAWSAADREHYGDNQPIFFRKEYTLAAKADGQFVGYITIIADSGVGQIEPLMVQPDLKGKGIGIALLKAAEDKAKSLGIHKIWLETGVDWKSKTFYEKHGYQVRAILPNHTGGREFVLMDKML